MHKLPCAKIALVEKSKHCNISPEIERREVEPIKRFVSGDAHFPQEMSFNAPQWFQHRVASMINRRSATLKAVPQWSLSFLLTLILKYYLFELKRLKLAVSDRVLVFAYTRLAV